MMDEVARAPGAPSDDRPQRSGLPGTVAGSSAPAGRLRRLAASTAVLACLAVAAFVYSQQGFVLDPRALRSRIEAFGWLAPAAYVVAAALRPFLFLPSWVVMSAGGLLFGIWGGIVWGSVGFSLGAAMAFLIARGLGRDVVATRLRGRATRVDAYVSERGAPWMALYTAVPVSILTPVHLGAGLSGMSLAAFGAAAIGGFVPRTAIYSFVGDAIARGDWDRAGVAMVLIVVGGAAGILVVQRWGRARARRSAAQRADVPEECP
jgi:uncharacterized membrane protein YdjX (TVP38/TMEM64 family)